MWTVLKVAAAGSILCLAAQTRLPASAQSAEGDSPVLLSAMEGQALVKFALQHERRTRPRPDCSHLVHTIYDRAGLHYSYADSRDLYNGEVEEFERISRPQPGDLVAWRGHVGIVVSPEDKTFFSSVRSGIITEPWTTDYWKMRGHPRFLRYRVGAEADRLLLARLVQKNANGDAEPSESATDAPDSRHEASGQQPADADDASIIAEIRGRKKPRKQDIEEALRLTDQSRARQGDEELFDSSRPISVFERIEVRRIKIKDNAGTVTLRVSEAVSVEKGKAVPARIIERELRLSRKDESWIISDPQERMFLSRQVAVAAFEHQTQILLRRSPGSTRTRAMVKALDLLYDFQQSLTAEKTRPVTESRKHPEGARD